MILIWIFAYSLHLISAHHVAARVGRTYDSSLIFYRFSPPIGFFFHVASFVSVNHYVLVGRTLSREMKKPEILHEYQQPAQKHFKNDSDDSH